MKYDINRVAANMSVLLWSKIDKSECLTGEEILDPQQNRPINETKFAYSPPGKAIESKQKQLKSRGRNKIRH